LPQRRGFFGGSDFTMGLLSATWLGYPDIGGAAADCPRISQAVRNISPLCRWLGDKSHWFKTVHRYCRAESQGFSTF
jgi:hypothetical protein